MLVFTLDNILQLFTEHRRKIATASSILLIILISHSVADSVLVVMEAMNPPGRAQSSTRPETNQQPKQNWKVSDLDLFGKAAATSEVPQAIDAPETKLNLELQGVFISEDESRSTAIVGERNKTGELFQMGDRLPGNAVLAAVLADHVLIRRGQRMEKLMFADTRYRIEKAGPVQAAPVTEPVAGLSDESRTNLERIRYRIRNSPTPALQPPRNTTTTQDFAQYREKLKSDPVGALAEAGLTAVSSEESKGYRISDSAQRTVRRAGLQPGDVILSVNGRPVGVAANDSALVDQVMSASRVRVEVQRGSRRFFLTVPVPK